MSDYQGLIHKYRQHLPVKDECVVSLCEGNTPLIKCSRLREHLNLSCDLYLKYEGLNPTSSFKDRGMTYALSKALESGAKAVICASTGNTSASAAAYAARAGIQAVVLIPEGKIAYGKLSQAIQYGAQVIQIDGNFDQALKLVVEISESHPISLVNSINPNRILGQMTAAFEVVEQLGEAPDFHFIPVGNAGNISAYWKGYKTAHQEQNSQILPRMMGFQAEGAAPIVNGAPVSNPETVATAIRIGNPASWKMAEQARDESQGVIRAVSDQDILNAYDLVARYEGVFCEPASAASVAGVVQMAAEGLFQKGQKVVCTLTGHGLKDPDVAVNRAQKPVVCSPDIKEILKTIGL